MVTELIDIIINYVKSQTIVPLKRLGRYVGLGIAGSVFIALGLLLVNLGFLRFLQTLSAFDDTFSFVPYFMVIIVDVALIGIFFAIISRKSLIPEKK